MVIHCTNIKHQLIQNFDRPLKARSPTFWPIPDANADNFNENSKNERLEVSEIFHGELTTLANWMLALKPGPCTTGGWRASATAPQWLMDRLNRYSDKRQNYVHACWEGSDAAEMRCRYGALVYEDGNAEVICSHPGHHTIIDETWRIAHSGERQPTWVITGPAVAGCCTWAGAKDGKFVRHIAEEDIGHYVEGLKCDTTKIAWFGLIQGSKTGDLN
ncbi:uncharacterized protein VTP21DRAFT_8261 [Calcarisporiella thermophila]|uniref:uncharacterized protein n=1 Tax=Calcarisporiella thermophila TaxID=911321 RepID=UPI0037446F93